MHGYPAIMDSKVNSRNASARTYKNPSPHTHRNISPRAHRNPSPHTLNVHTRVEQVDGVNRPAGSLGVRSSSVSAPYYSNRGAQVAAPAERRKTDDIEFLKTIETTDRPYTPDEFAIDAFLSQKETVASRASSRKSSSLRSLASFGELSLLPTGYNNVVLNAQGTDNVLKKNKPEDKAMREAELKAAEATLKATVGTSSTKSKKDSTRSRSSIVLQDLFTPDVPHTATMCDRSSRGVVLGGNRPSSETDAASIESYSETCTPAHYISDAYRETGTVLRQTLDNGWSAAYESYKERRTLERTYRYGKSGKKAKVYMSGALPPSNEKAAIDQTLETNKSADEKPESATMAYGKSLTNERAKANAIGDPMATSSAKDTAAIFQASPEKKSAFVEHFNGTGKKEMSEDKVAESSKRKLFPIKWRLAGKRV